MKTSSIALILALVSASSLSFAIENGSQNTQTVAIKYEISSAKHNADWFMMRQADSVMTYNAKTQHGEIWTKHKNGEIDHQRVFSEDKKIIEYAPGELNAMNKTPDWNRIASIFSPSKIAELSKVAEETYQGNLVEIREGKLDGIPSKVWWIPALAIPAKIEQGSGPVKYTISIKELHTATPTEWNWTNAETLANYQRIDASDFGDMESDPFVKKVLMLDGHQQHQH